MQDTEGGLDTMHSLITFLKIEAPRILFTSFPPLPVSPFLLCPLTVLQHLSPRLNLRHVATSVRGYMQTGVQKWHTSTVLLSSKLLNALW